MIISKYCNFDKEMVRECGIWIAGGNQPRCIETQSLEVKKASSSDGTELFAPWQQVLGTRQLHEQQVPIIRPQVSNQKHRFVDQNLPPP